ncbi:hypothetical protein [Nocardiopsis nanhaiensis]
MRRSLKGGEPFENAVFHNPDGEHRTTVEYCFNEEVSPAREVPRNIDHTHRNDDYSGYDRLVFEREDPADWDRAWDDVDYCGVRICSPNRVQLDGHGHAWRARDRRPR